MSISGNFVVCGTDHVIETTSHHDQDWVRIVTPDITVTMQPHHVRALYAALCVFDASAEAKPVLRVAQ